MSDVRAQLAQIKDPLFDNDIVSLGYVKKAEAGDVQIVLPTPAHPHRAELEAQIRTVVQKFELSFEVSTRVGRAGGDRLPGVKNIIAVAAGKGGVGKSTVATNLAAALHLDGARVGLLDADIYGPSLPQMLGDPEVAAGADAGNKITPAVHHGMRVISVGFFVERGGAVIWRGPMVHKLL